MISLIRFAIDCPLHGMKKPEHHANGCSGPRKICFYLFSGIRFGIFFFVISLTQTFLLISSLIDDVKNRNLFSIFIHYEVDVIVLDTDPAKSHFSPRVLRNCFHSCCSVGKLFNRVQECCPSVADTFIRFRAIYKAISRIDSSACFVILTFRFLYKGIIIKHNKTEPTYTKTSLFLCEKRRFFMGRTEKGGKVF